MPRLALALALAAASVAAFAADVQAPSRLFTGADLFDLEQASDPQISPDGTSIAYVRRSGDVMNDRMRPTIWLVDARTGAQRPLAAGAGAHSSPRWSPDGRRLAYVSAADGAPPQLHVRWMDSGDTARITGLSDSPSAVSWSPDGRQIAYVMRVPAEPVKLGAAPAKPEGAKWADPLQVIDRVTYRSDADGYLKPGHDHLFVVAADGGALTQLTKRYGPDQSPALSPDGRLIAFLGYDDQRRSYTPTQLYVMNRDGTGVRPLLPGLDRDVEAVHWAGDGRHLYISYDDRAKKQVARVSLDGRIATVAQGLAGGPLDRPYTGGSFTVSANGRVAFTGGGATRPADLFVDGRQLTRLNEVSLGSKTMGQLQPLAVAAKDGRKVDSWLILPPGYQPGRRVPLILEIHGGPHTAYGPTFSTDNQLYAAAGYAVLYTNPRGSTSYGSDFANLIDKNYPSDDYHDLIAAVDAAVAAGIADPNNLFVTGGSGGGVLTSWIIGKTDRFKAAATQKPVINWISEALTMDNTGFTSRYWFKQQPWEDPMSYWNRSPLSLVGNVKTPTLVVVGANDYRTPVSESEQYYAALQIRGVPTALVTVPGAGHGSLAARPSQSAAKAAAILAWFNRYRTATGTAGD